MKTIYQLISLIIFFALLSMNFKPPRQQETLQAIEKLNSLPRTLQRALDPGNDFMLMGQPKDGDWLAEHKEAGQTFAEFKNSNPIKPNGVRNKIYLQPLGQFAEGQSPSLDILKAYAEAFFALEANILPAIAIGKSTLSHRRNPYTGNRQILTRDILILLKRNRLPDAFCTLAITMEDLYPHPSWNFVFGQASLRDRVGVFSFARYDPKFYGEDRTKDYQKLLLQRSCKVLVHETGHIFTVAHCIFFKCVMNGSNHLQESDARPQFLCPVCLRKLQHCIGFDVVERYRNLFHFYQQAGFDAEAKWVSKRLKWILDKQHGR
jgi:archaemetzincin